MIDHIGDEHARWLDPAEEPARWFAPPVAAVTATGQLLLTCTRLLFDQVAGVVACWDTDSLIAACTSTVVSFGAQAGPRGFPTGNKH